MSAWVNHMNINHLSARQETCGASLRCLEIFACCRTNWSATHRKPLKSKAWHAQMQPKHRSRMALCGLQQVQSADAKGLWMHKTHSHFWQHEAAVHFSLPPVDSFSRLVQLPSMALSAIKTLTGQDRFVQTTRQHSLHLKEAGLTKECTSHLTSNMHSKTCGRQSLSHLLGLARCAACLHPTKSAKPLGKNI